VFIIECLHSPHRLKYLKHFRTHFYILAGYLQRAFVISNQLPSVNKLKFYSYWFDEWATVIHLVKRISVHPIDIVCRIHGYDFDEAQTDRGYHLFRAFDLKGIDKVVSVSAYGSKYIHDRYQSKGVEISKLGVKDMGINPVQNGNSRTIVSCSALIPLKRVDLIIGILKEMKGNITWMHIGDGPLKKELLDQSLSLPRNINFIYKGQIENKEIIELYRNHPVDLVINVSELEGIPVSLMEAISFGIPIVGCYICGVPEIVNGQTGLLLEKDFKPKEAASQLESFLNEKSGDPFFRKGVKEFWRKNYNAERNYPEFINRYLLN
jgi:colanic acid/amylovoran biosynthesis glycosyltransferase